MTTLVVTVATEDTKFAEALIERGLDKQGHTCEIRTLHKEHGLNGVVEAAISYAMANEKFLSDMASDTEIVHASEMDVFQALESYVTDELAAK